MDSNGTLYPMRLVTKLTGLSADTIRAWERRHGAVTPSRTEGNTRRYTSGEVRRLLLLREATRRGHSIGSIAHLGARALERLLAEDLPGLEVMTSNGSVTTYDEVCQSYVGALCRYDGRAGIDLLMRCAARMDRRRLVEGVLMPIAREVDERWSFASVGSSHRHLFMHHLHALACGVTRPATLGAEVSRVVVASDARVPAESVALMACIVLAGSPLDPVYAGADLRRAEIDWALEMSQARAVVYVSSGRVPTPELMGLPAFFLEGSAPRWGELEEWTVALTGAPLSTGVR